MQFGICTSIENADLATVAGYDFLEEHIQNFLQPSLPDDQWHGPRLQEASPLPIRAANVLVPGTLKITGPAADPAALRAHMAVVMRRAEICQIETLVFGSGAARTVPDGFSRTAAQDQILEFLRMSVALAQQHNIMLVAEHLNKKECNIINTVAESMDYVKAINHPHLKCLADSYHLWLENEPLENVAAAMPWIHHVHISEKSRAAPSQSHEDARQYRDFFRVLKDAHYDRTICIEALWSPDLTTQGEAARVLAFVKEQWSAA